MWLCLVPLYLLACYGKLSVPNYFKDTMQHTTGWCCRGQHGSHKGQDRSRSRATSGSVYQSVTHTPNIRSTNAQTDEDERIFFQPTSLTWLFFALSVAVLVSTALSNQVTDCFVRVYITSQCSLTPPCSGCVWFPRCMWSEIGGKMCIYFCA